jgi:hypothetical protein
MVTITRLQGNLVLNVEGASMEGLPVSHKLSQSALCTGCGTPLSRLKEGELWQWRPKEGSHHCNQCKF